MKGNRPHKYIVIFILILVTFELQCTSWNVRKEDNSLTTASISRVDVQVRHLKISRESVMYIRLELEFSNNNDKQVEIIKYIIEWPDGIKEVSPDNEFIIPPGQSISRGVKIFPDAGKLGSLTTQNIKVTVAEIR